MKKMTVAALAIVLSVISLSASACPKGQHPYGGTGPHHKGGYCA